DIDPMFLRRWSARAMSGEPVSVEDLDRLLEAARWAPSSFNNQPWRFIWARAGTQYFPQFVDLLLPGNQPWCAKAGALIVTASQVTGRTHSFDAVAAWMSLALQASKLDLVAHAMEGFDYERAHILTRLPANHQVEC